MNRNAVFLAALAIVLGGCNDSDVIPYRATHSLQTSGARYDGESLTVRLVNCSQYEMTRVKMEAVHRKPTSPDLRIYTYDVVTFLPPRGVALVRLRLAGHPYTTWRSRPNVYRDRDPNFNSTFAMATNHQDWSLDIPVVRGRRPGAPTLDNPIRAILGSDPVSPRADERCAEEVGKDW